MQDIESDPILIDPEPAEEGDVGEAIEVVRDTVDTADHWTDFANAEFITAVVIIIAALLSFSKRFRRTVAVTSAEAVKGTGKVIAAPVRGVAAGAAVKKKTSADT